MLRDVIAAFQQSGDQQVFFVGVPQDDARTDCRGDHAETIALLFICHRRSFPEFGLGFFFKSFRCGPADGEIRIVNRTATCGT